MEIGVPFIYLEGFLSIFSKFLFPFLKINLGQIIKGRILQTRSQNNMDMGFYKRPAVGKLAGFIFSLHSHQWENMVDKLLRFKRFSSADFADAADFLTSSQHPLSVIPSQYHI